MSSSRYVCQPLQFLGAVPAGVVEQHDRVGAGPYMFGGLIKVLLHRPGIGLRQDERYTRIPCRTDSAKHVGAFVTLIDGLTGTRPTLRPLSNTAVLLAAAHLVLAPDISRNPARDAC